MGRKFYKLWSAMGKFERFGIKILLATICIYFVAIVCIKSKEAELNITSQRIEREITVSEKDVNDLSLSIERKTKFEYLTSVATSRGYYYRNNGDVTAYVKVEE